MAEKPENKKMDELMDYLLETYVKDSSLFRLRMWCHPETCNKKTINACERFHREFGEYYCASHPYIFKFLDVVTAFRAKVYMKFRVTARPVVATKRIKQLQKKVNQLKQLFDEGKLEVREYVH